jgi:hypothetical protein
VEMLVNAASSPQSAPINTAFLSALAVTVKNAAGAAVGGVNVAFTAPTSGASGAFSNNTTVITVATNASGVAAAPFKANATGGGPYVVSASAAGYPSATFSLTNVAAMSANPGTTPQSATVASAFSIALAVTVLNTSGKPVAGVSVTFAAPSAGASGTFSNSTASTVAATNSAGVASAGFIANSTAGSYAITAPAPGYPSVQFSMTNLAGGAASMSANAGTTPQTAAERTHFANALAVTVKDARGNLAPGVNVTFSVPMTGATGLFSDGLPTITVASNSSGVASAPFTAGVVPGTFTATASAPGTAGVNFSLTVTAGPPATIAINSGASPQLATVNTLFGAPLAVNVRDVDGNAVPGVAVTFGVPGLLSGAALGYTATTNASWIASVNATAAPVPLSYVIGAAVSGLQPVYFTLSALSVNSLP